MVRYTWIWVLVLVPRLVIGKEHYSGSYILDRSTLTLFWPAYPFRARCSWDLVDISTWSPWLYHPQQWSGSQSSLPKQFQAHFQGLQWISSQTLSCHRQYPLLYTFHGLNCDQGTDERVRMETGLRGYPCTIPSCLRTLRSPRILAFYVIRKTYLSSKRHFFLTVFFLIWLTT